MDLLRIEPLLQERLPRLYDSLPTFLREPLLHLLDRFLRLPDMRSFFSAHGHRRGLDILDEALDRLGVWASISLRDRARIPHEGRLVVVANHPLGGLDGLVLLRTLLDVRPDVKVVANDLLMVFPGLREYFLPYDIFSRRPQRSNLEAIARALENDEAVIFFPAAEVARLTWRGIRERKWHPGPVHFARKHGAPVLPVFIGGRNSWLFYLSALLSRPLSMFLLPREMFGRRGRSIAIKIGDPIPAASLGTAALREKALTDLLQKHLYRLGEGRKGFFRTESCIIHPVERRALRRELGHAQLLGQTYDGKRIFLADGTFKVTLREIARLREATFRKVGEGTGSRLDLDAYDGHYHHVVLWDDAEMEIVGAYRLGLCSDILARHGQQGLYAASLFHFSPTFSALLPDAAELGRSFVQPRYWNSRALDYLWMGIGAFLARRPALRWLYGCVSISNTYPEPAKDLLVHFYRTWFGGEEGLAVSHHPYPLSKIRRTELERLFPGTDYRVEARRLKEQLKHYGCTVPTLYKQYAELCEPGGVKFLDFGVDHGFGNCVDGLILVDVSRITAEKRARYLDPAFVEPSPAGEAVS